MSKASRKSSLAIIVAAFLAVGLALCAVTPAQADEVNMDEVNEQALKTLAIQGYTVKQVSLNESGGSCAAVTSDGSLWTWGDLDPAKSNSKYNISPTQFAGLHDVIAVSLGYSHSAAITSDGSLWTWGSNKYGELGYETSGEDNPTPRKVEIAGSIASVDLGWHVSAAITVDGRLWTWGLGNEGQLGDATRISRSDPRPVESLLSVSCVTIGTQCCAVTTEGDLYTWGHYDHVNLSGDLGYKASENYVTVPRKVDGIPSVIAADIGGGHSAAVGEDGSLWTWGSNNENQLGYETEDRYYNPTPHQVPRIPPVASVSVGALRTVAVTEDGSLWTWGDLDANGGIGRNASRREDQLPQKVEGLSGVMQCDLGVGNGGIVCANGSLWMWGSNSKGALGAGIQHKDLKYTLTPIQIFEGSGEIAPAKAALSLSPSSLSFTQSADKQTFSPASAIVTLTHTNCTSEPISDSRIDVAVVSSSAGRTTYRITPRAGSSYPSSITLSFTAKSTASGVADPSAARLTVNFKAPQNTYFEDIVRQTQATQYNPNLAYELAKLANMAEDMSIVGQHYPIENQYEDWGFTVDENDYADDYTAAFTLGSKTLSDGSKMVLIVVRGSYDLDWGADFNTSRTEGLVGWHRGFTISAEAIQKAIELYQGGIKTDGTIYVVTGHSLGAATANLVSMKLDEAGVSKYKVYDYNFACPDVAYLGDADWNPNGAHDNIFNLCNSRDLIPFVPSAISGANRLGALTPWAHWGKFGQTRWFTADNAKLSNPVEDAIEGHQMGHYVDYMAKKKPIYDYSTTADANAAARVASVILHCPVDATVYDAAGTPIASVANGEVNYYDSKLGEVFALVDGDEKYFFMPAGVDYKVEIKATDAGEMSVEVNEGSLLSKPETKTFTDVELTKGKTFEGTIAADATASTTKLYVTDSLGGTPIKEVQPDGSEVAYDPGAVSVWRLYNESTGEHLYTTDAHERDVLASGVWLAEGEGWKAPTQGEAVYRLYDPSLDDHLYTTDANEVRVLTTEQGWLPDNDGKPLFYSGGTVGIFRLYHGADGRHLITKDGNEYATLPGRGWTQEGVKLHAVK